MNRWQRAFVAILAIPSVTAAGIALIRCGCSAAAYTIELATAVVYLLYITAAPRNR
jgi:hypothetical protein